ncbi:hypothetical protein ACFX11_045411 [Malus domestica]
MAILVRGIVMGNGLKHRLDVEMRVPVSRKPKRKPVQASRRSKMLKPPDLPKQDYIQVQARKGQATDSRSLAERARRGQATDRRRNQLEGPIPKSVSQLGNLQSLDLSVNKLTGGIPVDFGTMSQLATLVLSNNSLSGVIPRNLCSNTKSLELLMIPGSGLVVEILAELSQCRSMKHLNLSNNLTHGSIPDEIYGLVRLTDLLLHNNSLGGLISPLDRRVPMVALWSLTHAGDTGNGAEDYLC